MATPRNTAPTSAAATKSTAAPKEVTATASAGPQPTPDTADSHSVTIPLDHILSATVHASVAAAKMPVTAARRITSAENGLPVYVGLGALVVVGVAEWPVIAAAGAGVAALRRWGPLRPAPDAAHKTTASSTQGVSE